MRLLLVLMLLAAGCFDHARIAVTELPKLNAAALDTHDVPVMTYSPITGQVSMGTAAAIDHESAIAVRTIDGGTETIHGVPDVTVVTSRGSWSFDGKFHAEIVCASTRGGPRAGFAGRGGGAEGDALCNDNGDLSLTAPNRTGRIPLVDIHYADVHSVATRKTILVIGGISLAALVPIIVVAIAVH